MVQELIYLARILLALFLGFLIGYERKLREKEAGIRTHTVVSAGAALIMIVSKYGFADVADFDASRVAAQIVSGIGFIGAGMIIYRRQAVRGLTTAAGVWATAGIGMAAGSGLYIVAVGATVLIIVFQCLMHIKCRFLSAKRYERLKISFNLTDSESERVKELFSVNYFAKINAERKESGIVCNVTINTDKVVPDQYISQVLAENPFIRSIERCDDD